MRSSGSVLLIGLYLCLLLALLGVSLFDLNLFEGRRAFIGIKNYQRLLADSTFVSSISVTLRISAWSTVLSLFAAVALALTLGRLVLKPWIIGPLLLPWFVPPTSVGVLFQLLLDSQQGAVPALLGPILGEDSIDILGQPETAFWAAVLADTWQWLGILTLTIGLLAQRVPQQFVEAVTIFGGGGITSAILIWIPQLFAPITALGIFKLFWTFADYDRIAVLTNAGGPLGSMRTVGLWIDRSYFQFGDFGLGATAATVIAFAAIVGSVAIVLLAYRTR